MGRFFLFFLFWRNMMKMKITKIPRQLALFQDNDEIPQNNEPYRPLFFDFKRDGDKNSVIPNPTWKIPDWLKIPTDDPNWMPDEYAM